MEPSEQAPSTPPTRRRRRRWLIVAFVAVLVGVAWWNWPRGDARFVGNWRVLVDGADLTTMTLRANGSGISETPPDSRSLFRWRIENQQFVSGYSLSGRFLRFANWVSFQIATWTGVTLSVEGGSMAIVEVSPDRIVLRSDYSGSEGTVTLIRIPQ